MKKTVWEIKYQQRFGDPCHWIDYTDTFLGHENLRAACNDISIKLLDQTLNKKPCTGLQVLALTRVTTLTL